MKVWGALVTAPMRVFHKGFPVAASCATKLPAPSPAKRSFPAVVNNPPPPPDQQPEVINLEIDGDGTVVWNGSPVASLDQLQGYSATETSKDPQPEIHLRPDRRAKYDVVAKVLAAAQRNHMKKIGFVNVAEFKD